MKSITEDMCPTGHRQRDKAERNCYPLAMSRKRVCLFRGNATTDGNVDRIGAALMSGFAANGWAAELVDISQGDPAENFARLVRLAETEGVDFFLSVEAMGLMTGLEELMAKAGARQLYWALDHPYSGVDRLRGLAPGSVATFPTRSNLDCCANYIRNDLVLACGAHAAEAIEPLAWSERDIPILVVGNVDGPTPDAVRAGWRQLAAPWPMVLEHMEAAWRADPSTPLEDLARAALMATGATGADGHAFFRLQAQFDSWARPFVRHATVAALGRLPLCLVGRGWESLAAPGHTLLGPRPSREAAGLIARSRLVLNILPDYYRSHERVFAAMAAGCATVSSGAGYLANAMGTGSHDGDGTAMAYFAPLAERGEALARLWADTTAIAHLAEAGLSEFRAHHTWEHRVATLLARVGS